MYDDGRGDGRDHLFVCFLLPLPCKKKLQKNSFFPLQLFRLRLLVRVLFFIYCISCVRKALSLLCVLLFICLCILSGHLCLVFAQWNL